MHFTPSHAQTTLGQYAKPIALVDIPGHFTLIAPTQTHVQLLTQAFKDLHKHSHCSVVLPQILTLDQWLHERHLLSNNTQHVVSRYHTFRLLHNILSDTYPHLNDQSLWHYSQSLLKMLDNHTGPSIMHDRDGVDFVNTYRIYREKMRHFQALPQVDLHTNLPFDPKSLVEPLVFFGFSLTTPLLEEVWAQTPSQYLYRLQYTSEVHKIFHRHKEPQAELCSLLKWCQRKIAQNSTHRSVVVVPQDFTIDVLQKHINNQLVPGFACAPEQTIPLATSFSTTPLEEMPIIRALLNFMQFLHQPNLHNLQSAYMDRYWQPPNISQVFYHDLTQDISFSKDKQQDFAPWLLLQVEHFNKYDLTPEDLVLLSSLWQSWANFLEHIDIAKTPLTWGRLLCDLLQENQWPFFALNPQETQALDRFFTGLKHNDFWLETQEAIPFSRYFKSICTYLRYHSLRNFQQDAPLLIAHWQDIVDIPFANIYFFQMHANAWPEQNYTSQFDLDSSFWLDLQNQLQHQTSTWIHSYAEIDTQNQANLPSPMIDASIWTVPEQTELSTLFLPRHNQTVAIQEPVFGPSIHDHEQVIASSVLRLYNLCHCQGFIRSRLGVEPTPENEPGLPAWLIGQIVHSVLEQSIRLPLHDGDDEVDLDSVIQQTLQTKTYRHLLPPSLRSTTHAHVYKVCSSWLALHTKLHEGDSSSTCSHEVATQINLGSITVRLRADRVDILSDGSHRIIDYKTGKMSRSGWFGDRIAEPQLPLYALAFPDVRAISFASLHPDQFSYIGISADKTHPEGIQPPSKRLPLPEDGSWNQLLHHWHTSLTDTAQDYASGLLRKNPIAGANTCSHCGLHTICRLHDNQVEPS